MPKGFTDTNLVIAMFIMMITTTVGTICEVLTAWGPQASVQTV